MKTLTLERFETSDEGTFGKLINDEDKTIVCFTGELPRYAGDPDIMNEQRTDCIPTGIYTCQITNSPKFGKVYTVTNVPRRSAILIHSGNFCGDVAKGYKSHVLGCIILGRRMGTLDGQKAILASKETVMAFQQAMHNEPFLLNIVEKFV
jgi:hypothetical protein